MKGKELGKLLLDGLLVAQNGFLVAHYCVHVGPKCVHVLDDGDLVLLGLIPVRIESGGRVMYLVLQCSRRTDRVLLLVVVVRVGWMTVRPLPGHLLGSQT